MRRLPGKILAFIITICILGVSTVTANGFSMSGCCVQAQSKNLQLEPKANDHVLFPGCCAKLKNFSCQLMSDVSPEVWIAAITRVPGGENLAKYNSATAATGVFVLFDPPWRLCAPQKLLTTASGIPLYLRNLSLLI